MKKKNECFSTNIYKKWHIRSGIGSQAKQEEKAGYVKQRAPSEKHVFELLRFGSGTSEAVMSEHAGMVPVILKRV